MSRGRPATLPPPAPTGRGSWKRSRRPSPPLLALARLALLATDAREAIAWLDQTLTVAGETVTASHLTTAAAIALLADQPLRAATFRQHAAHREAARAATLARNVAEALGRPLPDRAGTGTLPPLVAPPLDGAERSAAPTAATTNGRPAATPGNETNDLEQDGDPTRGRGGAGSAD